MLILEPDGLLPKRKPKSVEYVLLLSIKDLRRNSKFHTSFADVVFLVFDTPVALSGFDIKYMDFKIGSDVHIDGFECMPLDLDLNIESRELVRTGTDIIQLSVEEVKAQRTLLNQLMTFIYTLPRQTHQKPVKDAVCSWMMSRNTLLTLNKDLGKMRGSQLNPKQLARLNDILSSETALIYKEAMREGGDADVLARRYGISAYEIRYMRASVAKR